LSLSAGGNFDLPISSNAHRVRSNMENAMGFVIMGMYLVSALAGAAGIGRAQLRR
jgi:hypothetical protein